MTLACFFALFEVEDTSGADVIFVAVALFLDSAIFGVDVELKGMDRLGSLDLLLDLLS